MTKEPVKAHHHRSSLKQKNKPFKGGRSKSRGRVAVTKKHPSSVHHSLNRKDRRNQHAQILQNKRQELNQQRRLFSGPYGMPRMVVVIPVTQSATIDTTVLGLDFTTITYNERNKQNLHFLPCTHDNNNNNSMSEEDWSKKIIDAAQVADCLCFVASARDETFNQYGLTAFSIIRLLGLSSSVVLLNDVEPGRNAASLKRTWMDYFASEGITDSKIYSTAMFHDADANDRIEFERTVCQQQLKGISWRSLRPYMVTDSMEVCMDGIVPIVKVTGFIRGGKPFSANNLIHIPSIGENFIVNKIELVAPSHSRGESNMHMDGVAHLRNEEEAESLESVAPGDPFAEDALHQAGLEMSIDPDNDGIDALSTMKKVPKGTSSYQAVWYSQESIDVDEEYEEITGEDHESVSQKDNHLQMDVDEHNEKYQEYQEIQRVSRHFPDEIALDPYASAKARLQKYRGVQSLRTSQWNPNENLPSEYSRIFRLANYKQSRKIAIEENDSPFLVGQKVILHIEGMSSEHIQRLAQQTLIVGLLRHEQKFGVLNFNFTLSKSFTGILENKEELVAVIGPRRFIINPIFSEHNSLPLHKMIREVGDEAGMVIGTIFAPITFTPCPILLFRPGESGKFTLIGSGSVVDSESNRIILKRVTLTGSPFRVHKRAAVIRFMFSNPTDVNWFKPVELTTKTGARGHIKESLGTHGYMKCLFDRTIFQHDTVAMHLYKRVFPKWTTRYFC